MAINLIRATFFAVLISLFFTSATAQNDTSVINLAGAKELGEKTKIITAALLQHEKGVTQEIRRGVARLVSACSPSNNISTPTAAPEKANEYIQRKLEGAAKQDQALLKRVDDITSAASKAKDARCGSNLIPFLRSKACQTSIDLIATSESLRSSLQSYNNALQERYKLYAEVASKENEGCVRKGFTERLLRANDDHMNEQEEVARVKLQDLLNQAQEIAQQVRQ
jgi:hypothetical protein